MLIYNFLTLSQTLLFKGEICSEGKLSKEWLTIPEVSNMISSEKKLLVIRIVLLIFIIRLTLYT